MFAFHYFILGEGTEKSGGEGGFDDGREKVVGHSLDRKWSALGKGGAGLGLFTKVEV